MLLEGYVVNSQGGKTLDLEPTGPIPGTTVEISDLFFNTPARLKFLKSEAGETAAIKKTCRAFSLANPQIGINLSQEGKSIFRVLPQDWFERSVQVLQLKKDQCVFAQKEFNGFKIKLTLSLPETSVQTTQSIWLFVNSRPVQDRTLQQAVLEGYRNLLLVGNYPQVVCDVQIDPADVDVNVHPAKTQVKFKDASQVFRAVSGLIKEKMAEIYSKPEVPAEIKPLIVEESQQLFSEPQVLFQEKTWEMPKGVVSNPEVGFSSIQLIGQFLNTYIVGQNQKGLILIDQHAAHERVLFETLKAQYTENNVSTQKELFEEVIEMPENLIEGLCTEFHLSRLLSMGLEIHRRGREFIAITSRPSLLKDIGLKPILEKMANQISEMGDGRVFEDISGDLIATMACHGAIRAGKVLSISEMQSLLVQMDKINFSQFCPHGRPVSVSFSVTDVEKLFKRIV